MAKTADEVKESRGPAPAGVGKKSQRGNLKGKKNHRRFWKRAKTNLEEYIEFEEVDADASQDASKPASQ